MTKKSFSVLAACLAVSSLPAARAADSAALAVPPPFDPANLDRSVKPGDDFYHFANGTWLKNNPIPPDQTRWGSFQLLDERNKAAVHAILDECAAAVAKGAPIPSDSNVRKVGDFYASGMDEAAVEADGAKPLQPYLNEIASLKDLTALPTMIAGLHSVGVRALFHFEVGADEKDSETDIAQLGQGGLGLPDRDYYLLEDEKSKTIRAAYEDHIGKMFVLLGDKPDVAAAGAKTVLAFETDLAKASKTRVDLRDPLGNYHKMTVGDLDKSAPGFGWNAYFAGVGSKEPGGMDVGQPEFAAAMAHLVSTAPLDTVKTYLRWQLIHGTAAYLSKAFVDENFHLTQALSGAKENLPRWKRVLTATDRSLGEALGHLYVEKNFPPEAKARALEMVSDLKTVLRERLGNLEWMGEETRKAALNKLDHFGVKMGYPDKWRDYSALEIKKQSYVLNVLAANAFDTKRIVAKIGQPVDKSEWDMTPPTVNAYYNPVRNEIVFPAGILQPPFFSPKADDAINYGGIGGVIGHEMTHGFDDQGRQYDEKGNLKDWWSPEDLKHFEERGGKIVKQFYGYEIDGEHVNGRLTEGENIADLGGSTIAFLALEKSLARQGTDARDKQTDGFTPAQRFFLSWAQVWRTNARPETARMLIKVDPHSPAQFRCNGPLSNEPAFQKAFGLPGDCAMVRPAAEKVQIW